MAVSWYALGKVFPQKLLYSIFVVCLMEDKILGKFLLFQHHRPSDWLFYSISHSIITDFELFKSSIIKENDIWDYLVDQFEKDIHSKSSELNIPYQQRSTSYLIESILFHWPHSAKTNLTLLDLANVFLAYCDKNPNKVTKRLREQVLQVMPIISPRR